METLLILLAFGVLILPLALARWLLDRSDRRYPPPPPLHDPSHPREGHGMPRSAAHRRHSP